MPGNNSAPLHEKHINSSMAEQRDVRGHLSRDSVAPLPSGSTKEDRPESSRHEDYIM